MSKDEAILKYVQIIYEWNLPPLNKIDFEEYIRSQINGYFYTPLVWANNIIQNKVKNYE